VRDYGEQTKVIWDGDENCKHIWNYRQFKQHSGRGDCQKAGKYSEQEAIPDKELKDAFCQKCGAWYGQLGLEPTLDLYLKHLLQITQELKRVLKPTGVMFWNHGDSYGGSQGHFDAKNPKAREGRLIPCQEYQSKCLFLQNYRLILRMCDEQGWILRNTIIWHKPNHMPSSVKDRFANAYEPVFFLTKSKRYYFDLDAVRIPQKYPEDVARRIRQDKEDGIEPFAKGQDGRIWRRDQLFGKSRLGGFVRGRALGYKTKIPKDQAESFGSPRTRHHRKEKSQKFITHEQQKRTQERTGWIKGSGRIRSFFDNYGGQTNPAGKNPGDIWRIPTHPFSGSHFATFPEKLVEPMILAGCPEWVCKKCGKARVRISKVEYKESEGKWGKQTRLKDKTKGENVRYTENWSAIHQTIGWTDCGCGEGFRPGIVLDPFIGSGTTAVVARKLGRNWIGIELNQSYIDIAMKRLAQEVLF
jgi:DNA modification methylase